MRGAVRRVLKTDMREHGDDRGLGEGGHGQGQVALGHAKLAKCVNNRNQPRLRQPHPAADHVGLRHAQVLMTVGKTLVEKRQPGRAGHVGGKRENRQPLLRGAHRAFRQAGLDFIRLDSGRGRRGGGGFGFFGGVLFLPVRAQRRGPGGQFGGDLPAKVNLIDKLDDFFAAGQRKAVSARGALHRGLDSIALDRFDPEANRRARIGPRLVRSPRSTAR